MTCWVSASGTRVGVARVGVELEVYLSSDEMDYLVSFEVTVAIDGC